MTTDTTNNSILSFEHKAWGAASAILVLLISVFAYVWTSRVAMVDVRFEKVDSRFEKIDTRFENVDNKLDNIAITLAKIEAKMATKDDIIKLSDRIANNEKHIAMLNIKVENLKTK